MSRGSRRRDPGVSLYRRDGRRDREPAGRHYWDEREHVPRARTRPARWPTRTTPGRPRPAARTKLFVLDMFPYPSGAGLHVGHPLGYIGTDCFARFQRMAGYNVLHTMGFDAFGLPAEQYAVETGTHPRITTEANIEVYRRQLHRLGLGYDPRRSVDHHGRRVLPLDPVDLPADLQLLVRRRTPTRHARSTR